MLLQSDSPDIKTSLGLFNNSSCIPVGQFRIETQTKLRKLDRDVGPNALFVDLREYVQILFNFAFRFRGSFDRLIQVIERSYRVFSINLTNDRNYLINRVAGDETGGEFLE